MEELKPWKPDHYVNMTALARSPVPIDQLEHAHREAKAATVTCKIINNMIKGLKSA